jgi:hypothetical protein
MAPTGSGSSSGAEPTPENGVANQDHGQRGQDQAELAEQRPQPGDEGGDRQHREAHSGRVCRRVATDDVEPALHD